MRINKFVAAATGMSRRTADESIRDGRITINGRIAVFGDKVDKNDKVRLDGADINVSTATMLIMFNKPAGYVCSRKGQGSRTVYDLLPEEYHRLKTVGRLDKDSSGLLLLTDDGDRAYAFTHPKHRKEKVYKVKLDKKLDEADRSNLLSGVDLPDGLSKFIKIIKCSENTYEVILAEGRNRQIRRTFSALGYEVEALHRTVFGPYRLGTLKPGEFKIMV